MSQIFRDAFAFDCGGAATMGWDVANVTTMESGFYADSSSVGVFNTNISAWDTRKIVNFDNCFRNQTSFAANLHYWNVENVTSMADMFKTTTAFATAYDDKAGYGDTPEKWFFIIKVDDLTKLRAAATEFCTPTADTNSNEGTDAAHVKYGLPKYWFDPIEGNCTNFENLFQKTRCGSDGLFNEDLSGWKTQSVTTMEGMFQGCTAYNKPMPLADTNKWNVSAVTTMKNMFNGCTSFDQALSTWTTGAVKNMSSMFNDASGFNQDISSWQTHEVTDMASMFNGATSFAATGGMTKSSNQWNTVKVADMSSMFKNVPIGFNPNIEDWTTSSVTDMSGMFEGATGFNNGTGTALLWDVGKVTTMASMFKGAIAFDQDLSSWKNSVGKVKNMTSIFEGATVFGTTAATNNAINIRDWAIDEAESPDAQLNLHSAFKDASNMAENIRYWDVASGVTTTDIFSGATAYSLSDYAGTDHENWNDGTPGYQYFDYTGTVCFLGSEKVRTDQGSVRFDKLTTDYTINGYNIKKVTKMLNSDDHLIFVGKDAVNKNIPNKGTYISRNHGIVMNNHIVRAKTLENGTTVLKIPREPDMIYNVLTIPQTIMFVNNMPCETINPSDPIVQRYI